MRNNTAYNDMPSSITTNPHPTMNYGHTPTGLNIVVNRFQDTQNFTITELNQSGNRVLFDVQNGKVHTISGHSVEDLDYRATFMTQPYTHWAQDANTGAWHSIDVPTPCINIMHDNDVWVVLPLQIIGQNIYFMPMTQEFQQLSEAILPVTNHFQTVTLDITAQQAAQAFAEGSPNGVFVAEQWASYQAKSFVRWLSQRDYIGGAVMGTAGLIGFGVGVLLSPTEILPLIYTMQALSVFAAASLVYLDFFKKQEIDEVIQKEQQRKNAEYAYNNAVALGTITSMSLFIALSMVATSILQQIPIIDPAAAALVLAPALYIAFGDEVRSFCTSLYLDMQDRSWVEQVQAQALDVARNIAVHAVEEIRMV